MDKKEKLKKMFSDYSGCTECPNLTEHRTQVVFGSGRSDADLMIIGTAPGEEDDRKGMPFLGTAGRLLIEALAEAGVARKDVYLTNVVLCRPTNVMEGKRGTRLETRSPTTTEQKTCRSRLMQEIYNVDPKIVLLLGNTAASLATRSKITSAANGSCFEFKVPGLIDGIELPYQAIVTFLPSHVLKSSPMRTEGSIAKKFFEHVALACDIIRSGQYVNQDLAQNTAEEQAHAGI